MAQHEKESTLRTVTGIEQPVSATILSTDDPLHLGRICVYPDHWDPSKVPLTSALWAHTESPDLQTAGIGSTRHAYHLAGERCQIQYDQGGTPRIRRAETTYTGGDAPAGSSQAPQGKPTYPGNIEQGT
jgi:hypothetical protein